MLQRGWSFSLPLVCNGLLQTWEIIYHGICMSLHYLGEKRKEMGRKWAERGESGRLVRVRRLKCMGEEKILLV